MAVALPIRRDRAVIFMVFLFLFGLSAVYLSVWFVDGYRGLLCDYSFVVGTLVGAY